MSDNEEERAVSSIPLDGEDGEKIVISQQNMGGYRQVGGGEFKNVDGPRSPEDAAAEQDELEREAPVDER